MVLNILAQDLLFKSKQRGWVSASVNYNPSKVRRAAKLAVWVELKERGRHRVRMGEEYMWAGVAKVEGWVDQSLRAMFLNARPLSIKCRGEGAFYVLVTVIESAFRELNLNGKWRSYEWPH